MTELSALTATNCSSLRQTTRGDRALAEKNVVMAIDAEHFLKTEKSEY
jgi:hypothetical protein